MVKASRPAATQLVASPSMMTEKPERVRPIASASSGATRPEGMGREAVRFITRSISASYHMFSAPDAPPPMAMQSTAKKAMNGWMPPGAARRPTAAVKTTSDMTRGLSRAT